MAPRPQATPERTVALVIAAVLLLVACGEQPVEPGPSPSPDPDATTAAPEEPADAEPGDVEEVAVWFAHESGMWVEPETITLEDPTPTAAHAAMEALVAGDAAHPQRTTLAPEGTAVLDVDIDGPTLRVDLSDDVTQSPGGSAQEQAFAQQLAHTAVEFDPVEAVQLLVEGEPITELWGHLDWSGPIHPDEAAIAPILILEPAWGSTQPPGPVTAAGTSMTFEATVELRLVDPGGSVVEETFTTAAQPDIGERGPWEHTFEHEATTEGTWTIEAIEPDPSAGQGRPPFTTTTQIEIS